MNEDNAHPLTGCDDGKLAIVLNGIVENYRELQGRARGRRARLHLARRTPRWSRTCSRPSTTAISSRPSARVYERLEGHFTFVVIHHDEPNRLVGVRRQTPLVIGLGNGENFLASNLAAFLAETRRVQYPGHGDVVEVTPDGVRVVRAEDGSPVELEVDEIDWDEEVAEREGYETFMLKEIYEQPEGFARDDRRPRPPRPRSSRTGSG